MATAISLQTHSHPSIKQRWICQYGHTRLRCGDPFCKQYRSWPTQATSTQCRFMHHVSTVYTCCAKLLHEWSFVSRFRTPLSWHFWTIWFKTNLTCCVVSYYIDISSLHFHDVTETKGVDGWQHRWQNNSHLRMQKLKGYVTESDIYIPCSLYYKT